MKKIPLTRGMFALVDNEDFEYLNQWKWNCSHYGYAVRQERDSEGKKRTIWMHRVVCKTPIGYITDHKNLNKLDNRRANLRVCNKSQNGANRIKYKNNKSGYKGVSWSKTMNKWEASIRFANRKISIGYYSDESKAAVEYDKKAKELYSEFALPNGGTI